MYMNEHERVMRFVINENDYRANPGEQITTVIPYLIPKTLYSYLNKSYGTDSKFWVCPSFVRNNKGGHWSVFHEKGLKGLPEWYGGGQSLHCYYVGFAGLAGMDKMTNAKPGRVEESAITPTDKGNKLLAADLNIRWSGDWNNPYSAVAHPKNTGGARVPEGGHRLYLGGNVDWVPSSVMARDDEAITENARGKFDHWKSSGSGGARDYFW
jgi:hypothetical protein